MLTGQLGWAYAPRKTSVRPKRSGSVIDVFFAVVRPRRHFLLREGIWNGAAISDAKAGEMPGGDSAKTLIVARRRDPVIEIAIRVVV